MRIDRFTVAVLSQERAGTPRQRLSADDSCSAPIPESTILTFRMRVSVHCPASLAILLAALVPSLCLGQDKSPVSLQTFPKQLSLAGGESARIIAVVTINGDAVRNVKLTAHFGLGIWASIGKPPDIPEGFHGDVTWPVVITKADDGRASSDVTLEARYSSGDAPKQLLQSAFTSLTVTLKSRPKVEDVVTGTIDATFEKLEERRPQFIHVTLTNVSDVPVTITSLAASVPGFAQFVADDGAPLPVSNGWTSLPLAAGAAIIQPRQEFIARFNLGIADNSQLLSGKYLLLVRADLQYRRDGYQTKATVGVKKEFQVGVLGETEFVGITSVPFLVLPGFVFITGWAILLSRGWPRWPITLDYKKPEYYFLSVLAAFGQILLYYKISPAVYLLAWGQTVKPRDLFSGYSLADIINVWLLAVSAVLVPWIVVFGLWSLGHLLWALAQKEKTPQSGDSPETILLKLARSKKTFDLPQVTVAGVDAWELPLPSPDPAKKWISSRVEVSIEKDKTDVLEAALDDAIQETNRPGGLYETLNRNRTSVKARWEDDHGPQLVDKKDGPRKQGDAERFVYYLKQ
jgi:hypothetical protein